MKARIEGFARRVPEEVASRVSTTVGQLGERLTQPPEIPPEFLYKGEVPLTLAMGRIMDERGFLRHRKETSQKSVVGALKTFRRSLDPGHIHPGFLVEINGIKVLSSDKVVVNEPVVVEGFDPKNESDSSYWMRVNSEYVVVNGLRGMPAYRRTIREPIYIHVGALEDQGALIPLARNEERVIVDTETKQPLDPSSYNQVRVEKQ